MSINDSSAYEVIGQEEQELDSLPLTTGTGEILNDRTTTGRVSPWRELKQQNMVLARMYSEINAGRSILWESWRKSPLDPAPLVSGKFIGRLHDCSSYLWFDRDEEQNMRLKRGNFCKSRFCPTCNWRRSLRQFHQTSEQVSWIRQEYGDVKFIFLTLTVKNVPNSSVCLEQAIKHLSESWLRIVTPRFWNPQKNKTLQKFRRSFLGASRALEITFHPDKNTDQVNAGEFHPHLHVILAMRPTYYLKQNYLKQADFAQLWKEAARLDYDPVVDVRELKGSKGIAEASKYAVKLSDVIKSAALSDSKQDPRAEIDLASLLALEHLHEALERKQALTLSGVFHEARRVLKQNDVDDDLVHVDDDTVTFNPVERVLFEWKFDDMQYIC